MGLTQIDTPQGAAMQREIFDRLLSAGGSVLVVALLVARGEATASPRTIPATNSIAAFAGPRKEW
jgi:hypothetical protein